VAPQDFCHQEEINCLLLNGWCEHLDLGPLRSAGEEFIPMKIGSLQEGNEGRPALGEFERRLRGEG
jgi:hypothetical protein